MLQSPVLLHKYGAILDAKVVKMPIGLPSHQNLADGSGNKFGIP